MRLVDLDDAAGLELAWMELAHRRAIRQADPALRAAIERCCAHLDPERAAPILAALDEVHPAVVLDAHFAELVPNHATIGAIRRRRGAVQ